MIAPEHETDRRVLAVMARYPVPGATKTRLAASIGVTAANRLYRAFLLDLEERLRVITVPVRWFYTGGHDFAAVLRYPASCAPQADGDLGHRMADVFARLFDEGVQRAVMIGSDTPHVDVAVIEQAFERLAAARVVFGPADDGGYYLIGLAARHDLFSAIPWSTPVVLAQSRERARSLGLDVELLPPNFDIDDANDLARLRRLLAQRAGGFLTATRAVLTTIRTV